MKKGIPFLILLTCLLLSLQAEARFLRIQVLDRTAVAGGASFGATGPYERIRARVFFAVRPEDVRNAGIVDLGKAPRNASGEVEFSADLWLLKPKIAGRGNGAMLLEVPNRGSHHLMSIVDGGPGNAPDDPGDGWLLRKGYTVAALGWQWDAPNTPESLRLYAPVAHQGHRPIIGLLRDDFTPFETSRNWPLGHVMEGRIGGIEYPAAFPDDSRNVLTVRDAPLDPRRMIQRDQWSFARDTDAGPAPSRYSLLLKTGFQPGKIYELVYVVQNPVVAGLGFAAVRDFVSWVRSDPSAVTHAARVYGQGISQSGRWLRDFLYEGFNQDEQGHQVFDGVLAHVAGAGRGSFNYRFAQPSRDAQPMSSIFWPTDIFPFTGLPEPDAAAGPNSHAQGLLDSARSAHVVPKIFFSCTSYEYWGRAMSLTHTSANGFEDAPVAPQTRIYFFAGLQHFSGPWPPAPGAGDLKGQQLESPLPIRWFWRALITNMDAWVRRGIAPPPSSYPRIADHTLVPLKKLAFPAIPHVQVPSSIEEGWRLDFGPGWKQTRILAQQPPRLLSAFPALVPQVDADGIDRAGIHLPELSVPLATYTGWNLRDPSIGASHERVSFLGSYIPFAKTAAERTAVHDPRPSIAERYTGRAEYLRRYKQATENLSRQRWLLPEDVPAVLAHGKKEWEYANR